MRLVRLLSAAFSLYGASMDFKRASVAQHGKKELRRLFRVPVQVSTTGLDLLTFGFQKRK